MYFNKLLKMLLRQNQIDALNISKNNDFESGIHYHATGSGKSWIAMHLLNDYYNKYPDKNVLWICERKDILIQQFSKQTLKDRNFDKILKNYNVLDFVTNKKVSWYDSLNSSKYWKKSFLCIINRCYLVSQKKYEKITNTIDLIIHDECHSIENKTTQLFYNWIKENYPNCKIIGFSATPEKIEPLTNILSEYNIYNAFMDNVILPPKIVWIKSESKLTNTNILTIAKSEIDLLPYKKIIVWCGIIDECIDLAKKWKTYYKDYDICIDFNNITKYTIDNDFKDFEYFYNKSQNAILFCAIKHREGSDIPNVDGCIFLDLVCSRSQRVFIQCMGRVLRKDTLNKKKYGLVLDVRAHSTIQICNRIQYYLKLDNIFPWDYSVKKIIIDGKSHFINSLIMTKNNKINNDNNDILFNRNSINKYFVRTIPNEKYKERLDKELDLIESKNLIKNLVIAVEILELTKDIPHVTRGSCGSSLVCYMLGISHTDPIKYNISFARFLNKFRDTLPDIDFDFPHYLRDEVFLKLYQKWGDKIARISNHNYYHEKSALRKSLQINGINKFISKYDIKKELKTYDSDLRKKILSKQKELIGQFRGFSLHCGGIIYFEEGVPKRYILDDNTLFKQVILNKKDVSDSKSFKIDILSSRGLSQLYYCNSLNNIDFNMHIGDQKTIDLLSSGDNIGITLAETPLIRKAFLLVKPKTITDVAICLAIIRPAAKNSKKDFELGCFDRTNIVFDDDIIFILKKILKCDEDLADKIRREYIKGNKKIKDIVDKYINKKNDKKFKNILSDVGKYGFCKAHALSYAQLVWQLAYQKANFPEKFWKSTLKNVCSCYRKWVHIYEARCNNVYLNKNKEKSIYSKKKQAKISDYNNQLSQLRKFGYWNMTSDNFYKDCYYFINNNNYIFRGLIASSRNLKYNTTILFVGVSKNKYIEIVVNGDIYYNTTKVIVKGRGKLINKLYQTINCKPEDLSFI